MKAIKRIIGIIIIISCLAGQDLQAQGRSGNRGVKTSHRGGNHVGTNHYKGGRYRTQPIYRNPHYRYPRHRRVIRTLPAHHVRVVYRGLPYFFYAGLYYTIYNDGYIAVLPPVGVRIAVLPVGHVRVVVGSSVMYYHSGIYYTEIQRATTEEERYEVIQPPVDTIVSEISADAEEVMIDGNVFYEYNDVMYKKVTLDQERKGYKVVYVKENEEN